ncbi:hypothetical protein GCK72_003084 [Caenorhabditis remanei]|uniref:Uncharacterized protein n=1 Tax=Caenorhabditis remanei TaxID=31234 RepID=A0A6A5HTI7_CAERE|nr:hypothetical protein GCK72_003084 [Caenorhabditis remanei]KAF1771258.1 hypothetical protein GCK72_003084 [Caenorhabditis remanei]
MILSDPELIKKIPLVERAINAYNPDWETTDTIVKTPLVIPYAQRGGKFVLDNMLNMGCEEFLLCFDYGIIKWLCDNIRIY